MTTAKTKTIDPAYEMADAIEEAAQQLTGLIPRTDPCKDISRKLARIYEKLVDIIEDLQ